MDWVFTSTRYEYDGRVWLATGNAIVLPLAVEFIRAALGL